ISALLTIGDTSISNPLTNGDTPIPDPRTPWPLRHHPKLPAMGLKIGVLGAGSFASRFIPLFQAHPAVEAVYLAEALPERRRAQAEEFGVRATFEGLDDLLASDCDAVAIFTQRWLHGAQAVRALRA